MYGTSVTRPKFCTIHNKVVSTSFRAVFCVQITGVVKINNCMCLLLMDFYTADYLHKPFIMCSPSFD